MRIGASSLQSGKQQQRVDFNAPQDPSEYPDIVRSFRGHKGEVLGVDFNSNL